MVVILVTVIVQGFLAPAESRGSLSTPELTVNSGIFQAIGVISFGMYTRAHTHPHCILSRTPILPFHFSFTLKAL